MCRDCFYSPSDRRSYVRCEGAKKTVVSWACELLYSQSWCFGISELQEIQKQVFLTSFLLTGNHLSKRVHVRASVGPAHIGVAVRVLVWTVSA